MADIFYFVLVILLLTRIFGELAVRMGQTVLVGELISGVVLGALVSVYASSFPVLASLAENEVFYAFKKFGIFFLMLMAGMELAPKDLLRSWRKSFIIALFALLAAYGVAWGLGAAFIQDSTQKSVQIFFLCIVLGITAVPVLIKTLMDLELVDKTYGKLMVSAAFFVEIVSLALLVLLTKLMELPAGTDLSTGAFFEILGRVVLFFVVIIAVGKLLFPIVGNLLKKVVAAEFEFSTLIIFALIFSLISEALEMHFLIGAFMAGLFFERSTVNTFTFNKVTSKIEGLTLGFFAPIFFASIGLQLNLEALSYVPEFIIALIVGAILCKIIGGSLTARYLGASNKQSLLIGMGLTAKGSLDLIVAGIAADAGLFDNSTDPVIQYMFSSIVIMSITTTILVPVVMRAVQKARISG